RSSERSRQLWDGAARLLADGPDAQFDESLAHIVRAATTDGDEIQEIFRRYRHASGAAEMSSAVRNLIAALRKRGIAATNRVLTTITLRTLRPGSTPATDELTVWFLDQRNRLERLSGLALEPRQVAYVLSGERHANRLRNAFDRPFDDRRRRFDLLL